METKVGKISHYFGKIGVGVVELTDGGLSQGDTIKIKGGDREVEQAIASMQIDRQDVPSAEVGQSIGLKVDSPVKEGDEVFKVTA